MCLGYPVCFLAPQQDLHDSIIHYAYCKQISKFRDIIIKKQLFNSKGCYIRKNFLGSLKYCFSTSKCYGPTESKFKFEYIRTRKLRNNVNYQQKILLK